MADFEIREHRKYLSQCLEKVIIHDTIFVSTLSLSMFMIAVSINVD